MSLYTVHKLLFRPPFVGWNEVGRGNGMMMMMEMYTPYAISKVCALLAKPNLINYTNALALVRIVV